MVSKVDIIQVIDDEPELPGEMPEEMAIAIDRVGLGNALRALVQLTKSVIKSRVEKLFEGEQKDGESSQEGSV